MNESVVEYLEARWSAPSHVKALTTYRVGGFSTGVWGSLNLGSHVGDSLESVMKNRYQIFQALQLPEEPRWLNQVHSDRCVNALEIDPMIEADGSYTDKKGIVCAVMTADCLPIFLTDKQGSKVGVFHGGWRGLVQGIIESAVDQFESPEDVVCWLGPAIGVERFEIGPEVVEELSNEHNEDCFKPSINPGRWLADIYGLAEQRLSNCGVKDIQSDRTLCTYNDNERFFSHRRDKKSGRMASLIWME